MKILVFIIQWGIAYKALCLWDDAIEVLSRAVELNNDFIEGKKNLASCYHLNGNFNKAIELYKEVIKQSPLDLDTHHWLNSLLWELGDNTFLDSYLIARKISSNIGIDSDLAEELYRSGKEEEAFDIVKTYLKSSQCPPKLFLLAGDYLREQGYFDDSVKILESRFSKILS